MSFGGIPLAALDFYEDLGNDNSKAFWQANKHVYDECVKAPMEALASELHKQFGPVKFFRPYRDVRFSKDKTPYKDHQGAVVEAPGSGALYLHVDAAGLYVGGGMWHFAADQVQRFRRAVADDVSGAALLRLLDALSETAWGIGGDQLTRVPTGFAKDHPRADLLRRKALTASRQYGCPPWLTTPAAADEVAAAWQALAPLNAWLSQYVGPSELPAR